MQCSYMHRTKKYSKWVAIGCFCITVVLMCLTQQEESPIFMVQNEYFHYDLAKEEPVNTDQTCQLPRFHPFDASILKYLTPPKAIKCKERMATLTLVDQNGVLGFNSTALQLHGYYAEELECYFKEISRKGDFHVEYGREQRISTNGSRVQSDFVYVYCNNFAGIAFYTNVHCQINPKRISDSAEGALYNVLMFGIDSISRLAFMRHLPKTYRYLRNNLNAFVFRGMTKVGDNTFPNLAAMLTGKSVDGNELPYVGDPSGTYDDWPCLWKNYSNAGYVTFFAEDRPDIGLFTYLRGGLRDPPTDHYMRPFWLAMSGLKLHRLSSNLCFGNTPKHLLQLRYTRDFVSKYGQLDRAFFAFSFLVELSHDYVHQVSSADDDMEQFLRDMHVSGHLNRTFLFFVSDHGHRFDASRATPMGRVEERMPFLALVVPRSVSSTEYKAMDNLMTNEGRLTTPYDVYFTAMDVLGYSERVSVLGSESSGEVRGKSLFGTIAPNRSCHEAGIPEHYCICRKELELDVEDPRSIRAATTVTTAINSLLLPHHDSCADVTLLEVHRADLVMNRHDEMTMTVRVIVMTSPGNALFESTVVFRADATSVDGDISRINAYGSQSQCVNDAVMRKYCYCLER